jgi:hypothetical protein
MRSFSISLAKVSRGAPSSLLDSLARSSHRLTGYNPSPGKASAETVTTLVALNKIRIKMIKAAAGLP